MPIKTIQGAIANAASIKPSNTSTNKLKFIAKKSVRILPRCSRIWHRTKFTALQGDSTDDAEIKNSLNIEAIRIAASNQIRNIDEQLKQLNQLDESPEI